MTRAQVLITYTASRQEAILTRNAISILIHYCRRQVADGILNGKDVLKMMRWQYAVGALSKDFKKMEGIYCTRCMKMIPLHTPYYRRRSGTYTKTYHIECAERMNLRR
jgi:hypothetical protein